MDRARPRSPSAAPGGGEGPSPQALRSSAVRPVGAHLDGESLAPALPESRAPVKRPTFLAPAATHGLGSGSGRVCAIDITDSALQSSW